MNFFIFFSFCFVHVSLKFALMPDNPEDFLDQFNTFSIYQILPQLIDLWGLNVQTTVEARKNLAKVSGK